jgi:hypothetical protein
LELLRITANNESTNEKNLAHFNADWPNVYADPNPGTFAKSKVNGVDPVILTEIGFALPEEE